MNILLISNYFAPMNTIGALRPNSWARYWPLGGHSITVLTNQKSMDVPTNPFPQSVSVIEVGWYGKIREICYDSAPSSIVYNNNNNKFVKLLLNSHRSLRRYIFCNYLDKRSLWVPFVLPVARRLIKERMIEAIVSTSPAYPVHVLASKLKNEFPDLVWLADYRDLWSGNPMFHGLGLVRKIERLHEKKILKHADLVTTISEPLANYLGNLLMRDDIKVIYNGYEQEDYRISIVDDLPIKKWPVRVVYTGTVLSGLHDPEPFFQAIRTLFNANRIRPNQLLVEFYGDSSTVTDRVRSDVILKEIVVLKGKIARGEALKAQTTADLLLFLGAIPNGGAATDGVVSGKIFEYLTSGTEVMAVGVTSNMSVGQLISKSRAGDLYCNNVEMIANRLERLVAEGKVKQNIDREFLMKYRRDIQAVELLTLLTAHRQKKFN